MVSLLPDVAAETGVDISVRAMPDFRGVALSQPSPRSRWIWCSIPRPGSRRPASPWRDSLSNPSQTCARASSPASCPGPSRGIWSTFSSSIARLSARADLPLALRKDAGLDPGVLAWLLGQFPVDPLPRMLVPLERSELLTFRDGLADRLRQVGMPRGSP